MAWPGAAFGRTQAGESFGRKRPPFGLSLAIGRSHGSPGYRFEKRLSLETCERPFEGLPAAVIPGPRSVFDLA